MDEEGRFIGSVAPGTAADLVLSPESKHVFVVGSYAVNAAPKTWFVRHEVPRRSDQGVIVEIDRADARNCMGKWSGPLLPHPRAATLMAVAEAARGLKWLVSEPLEGNQWLDENRERVNELVGRVQVDAKPLEPVVTQAWQAH